MAVAGREEEEEEEVVGTADASGVAAAAALDPPSGRRARILSRARREGRETGRCPLAPLKTAQVLTSWIRQGKGEARVIQGRALGGGGGYLPGKGNLLIFAERNSLFYVWLFHAVFSRRDLVYILEYYYREYAGYATRAVRIELCFSLVDCASRFLTSGTMCLRCEGVCGVRRVCPSPHPG